MILKASPEPAPPLQLRARRPEALALALVLWASALWVVGTAGPLDRFGTLKGTDFSQFYVSARLVATGHVASLYDWSAYMHELNASVPGPAGLLYLPVYPPVLALLMAPLGGFPYLSALALWTVASGVAYLAAGAALIARAPGLRQDITSAGLLLIAFPAFQHLLLFGQVSAIAMLLVVLGWRGWTTGQPALAGVALGALAFKPQMLSVAASAILLAPSWPLAAGILIGVAVEFIATALLLGPGIYVGYAETVRRVLAHPGAFEPKSEQIQSLRGFLLAIGGESVFTTILFVAAAIGVLIVARDLRRRAPTPHLSFAIIAVAGLLVNPHLYSYDLVILLVPLALVTGWLASTPMSAATRQTRWAVLLLYWLPLVAPALGLLRVQLTAPAMVWLLWSLRQAVPTPAIARR
jgi:hypothetical protein